MKTKITMIAMLLTISIAAISQTWSSVGAGLSERVLSFYKHSNGQLFISGNTTYPATVKTWDGSSLGQYGPTVGNYYLAGMAEYGPNLMVLNTAGGMIESDGSTVWSNVIPSNAGYPIAFNNYVYWSVATGGNLRYWNGTSVQSVSGVQNMGLQPDTSSGELLLCGRGTYGTSTNIILCTYDPSLNYWTTLPNTGLDTVPFSFASSSSSALYYNGSLYMAGSFGLTTSTLHGHLYKWTGSTWTNIWTDPTVANTSSKKLVEYNGKLYFVSGTGSVNLYQYDSISGVNLIGTLAGGISDMIVYNNDLYVGGAFTDIDGTPYSHIAKYTDNSMTTGIKQIEKSQASVYPNPSNGRFTVDAGNSTIEVFNCVGQLISHNIVTDKQEIIITNPGAYIVRVLKENKVSNYKLINK